MLLRINCTNDLGKGRRPIVSTRGKRSIKDNIIDVFGLKQFQSLIQIKKLDPTVEDLNGYNLKAGDEIPEFELQGFISTCAHGQGRATTDRQFFFVNNRPCDPVKGKTVEPLGFCLRLFVLF